MKAAKLSLWNNKWSDVFDFTPTKEGDEAHFNIKPQLLQNFILPLSRIKTLFEKVNEERKSLGCNETYLFKDLNEKETEDLDKFEEELDSEEEKYKFSDSSYFTKYSCNMI